MANKLENFFNIYRKKKKLADDIEKRLDKLIIIHDKQPFSEKISLLNVFSYIISNYQYSKKDETIKELIKNTSVLCNQFQKELAKQNDILKGNVDDMSALMHAVIHQQGVIAHIMHVCNVKMPRKDGYDEIVLHADFSDPFDSVIKKDMNTLKDALKEEGLVYSNKI